MKMKKKEANAHRWCFRFDPEGKPRGKKVFFSLLTAVMLVLAGGFLGLMNLYFGTGRHGLPLWLFYFRRIDLVLLNVLPFILLILLLWALTNRAWISFLGTGIFCLIYSWAEYWKLTGRSDPIVAEDLTIIAEGMQMGVNYIMVTWKIVLSAVLVLLGTLVFFLFFRGKLPKLPFRLGVAVLILSTGWLLYKGPYTDPSLYNNYPTWEKMNRWIDSNKFISKGCIYPFLYSIRSAVVKGPDGYSAQKAKEILEQYPTDNIPDEKKVNVIVVMYEAFADLSTCTDRITAADPYASFHKLQEESIHGRLITNIFAAGTVDTERCVLGGFSHLTSFRRESWSYARYFAEQGYGVSGSHPSYESFYNRLNVNRNMGIERYYFKENHYAELSPNILARDNILLPEIVRLCREDLKTWDYVFSFNVTYQNHGPYPDDEESFQMPYVPLEGLDEASYRIVNNYLVGVEDTGNLMLAMADQLREDEEPFVLVFFGDHKPWLGDQNSVYTALGIDLVSENEDSFYRYYGTEYLIWANDAAKEKLGRDFAGEGPMISPCYLMNVLFEACGWEGPSFLKLSDTVRGVLPVVSSNGRFLENGRLVSEAEISEAAQGAYRELRFAEYYLMRDSKGNLPAA